VGGPGRAGGPRSRRSRHPRRAAGQPPAGGEELAGGSGAATRPWSCRWASGPAGTGQRRAVGRAGIAARWGGRAGRGELVAAPGRPGARVAFQRVGVGGGRLAGPVQLHHLLAMRSQEPGQADTVAAGARNRPTRWPAAGWPRPPASGRRPGWRHRAWAITAPVGRRGPRRYGCGCRPRRASSTVSPAWPWRCLLARRRGEGSVRTGATAGR
jgi:hypothetical protein